MRRIIHKTIDILKRIVWKLETNIKFTKSDYSNEIRQFEVKLMNRWYKYNPPFNMGVILYQTHPMLNLQGVRPTLSRINN